VMLSDASNGGDKSRDNYFRLIGFDIVPVMSARFGHSESRQGRKGSIAEWYAEHCPDFPLNRSFLPCLMAGPPRYLSLAGSARENRHFVSRVPMELCHIVSDLDETKPGYKLLATLLPGYRALPAK